MIGISLYPVYGDLFNLGMAFFVMVSILIIARYSKGFLGNVAVLCGLVIGFVVAIALGKVSFDRVAKAKWFDIAMPFAFGAPRFEFAAVATMCVVILVVMVESTGMFYAVGDTVGRPVRPRCSADCSRMAWAR